VENRIVTLKLDQLVVALEVFTKNLKISNLIKILPEGPELFHADRWTESYDEAAIYSSFAKAPKSHR